jgi:predicted transcriptional regulator
MRQEKYLVNFIFKGKQMTFKPVAREVFSVSQLIMMIHCIGKAKIRKKVNRNNYVCEYPNDDWEDLVKREFAGKIKIPGKHCYFLTDKGIEVIKLIENASN